MEKKICKICNEKKKISKFYHKRAICKQCYIIKSNYKEEVFKCYRCNKNCTLYSLIDGVKENNKIKVGKTYCCRKCLGKKRKKCKKCDKEHWATKSTKYCSKCRKKYNSNNKINNNKINNNKTKQKESQNGYVRCI